MPVPAELCAWADSDEGRIAVSQVRQSSPQCLAMIFDRRTGGSGGDFKVSALSRDAVRRASMLLQTLFMHEMNLRASVRRAKELAAQLEAAEGEIRSGLRTAFEVSPDVLGLIIGKQGANISRVKAETGVDTIAVDSQATPCMVRITGPTREAVARARRMLEYVVESVPLTVEQSEGLIDVHGAKLADIRDKSRLVRLTMDSAPPPSSGFYDHDDLTADRITHTLHMTGLLDDVQMAKSFVQMQIDHQVRKAQAQRMEAEAMERLSQLDLSYGVVGGSGGGDMRAEEE